YNFSLKPPTGGLAPTISNDPAARELHELLGNDNQINAVLHPFNSDNGDASLHIELSKGNAVEGENGEWRLQISGAKVEDRKPIHAWVEETLNRELFFLDHIDNEVTITIPGTARSVITVGAIDIAASAHMMKPYGNSSSGPCRDGREKPEVV